VTASDESIPDDVQPERVLRGLEFDPDGHLAEAGTWSSAVAVALAARDGVELGDLHWWLIEFTRRHYREYGMPPLMRVVVRAMREQAGIDDASSRTLYRLFPDGPIREACRYGGLPRPESCI